MLLAQFTVIVSIREAGKRLSDRDLDSLMARCFVEIRQIQIEDSVISSSTTKQKGLPNGETNNNSQTDQTHKVIPTPPEPHGDKSTSNITEEKQKDPALPLPPPIPQFTTLHPSLKHTPNQESELRISSNSSIKSKGNIQMSPSKRRPKQPDECMSSDTIDASTQLFHMYTLPLSGFGYTKNMMSRALFETHFQIAEAIRWLKNPSNRARANNWSLAEKQQFETMIRQKAEIMHDIPVTTTTHTDSETEDEEDHMEKEGNLQQTTTASAASSSQKQFTYISSLLSANVASIQKQHSEALLSVSRFKTVFDQTKTKTPQEKVMTTSVELPPTVPIDKKEIKEKTLMQLEDLLSLVRRAAKQHGQPEDIVIISDSETDFGLVELDQEEKEDAYIESKLLDRPLTRRITRQTTREERVRRMRILHKALKESVKELYGTDSKSESTQLTDTGKSPSVNRSRIAIKKSSGPHSANRKVSVKKSQRRLRIKARTRESIHLSESKTDDEDAAEILAKNERQSCTHLNKYSDAINFINELSKNLTADIYIQLTQAFVSHLKKVLSILTVDLSQQLLQRYREWILQPQPTILNQQETIIAEYAQTSDKGSLLLSQLIRSLVYAPCSESSVERLFSRLRFICGKRRYNLSLETINASMHVWLRSRMRLARL